MESHRFHALLVGLLALDRGDAETAIDAAARFLRRVGEADRFERVAGLDLMVRAAVAGGDDASAREAADEIAVIAAACPNAPLRAAALLAEGRVAAAAGEAAAACPLLEDASDLFDAAGARYDAALARLELASVLRVLGRDGPAAKAEARAGKALEELGARPPKARVGGLSAREAEVLRLVARGLLERRHRPRARAQRAHRGAPRGQRLPQDRRLRPHGARGRDRLGPRARDYVASDLTLGTGTDARAVARA